MKKILTYLFKAIYLLISWFVIAYTCNGEININLFCISVFTYAGGVVFDSLFYLYESFNANTILRKPIIVLSIISFVCNFIITITSILCSKFIIIPFDKISRKYIIMLNAVNNGFANLYPQSLNWRLDLSKTMTFIMVAGVFSLLPAFLLEVDLHIRIKNDKYNMTKLQDQKNN